MIDSTAIERLAVLFDEYGRPQHPLLRPVAFNSQTWDRWIGEHPAARAVLSRCTAGLIRRCDLRRLSRQADSFDQQALIRLFVAVMIWGSGRTNGRGPRYTSQALRDPGLIDALSSSAAAARAGQPQRAYALCKVRGVGPAFLTKWLWGTCLAVDVTPTPLILDSRVWAGLRELGWDSREAAGSRRRADRYRAYLLTLGRWADGVAQHTGSAVSAEVMEWCLFRWAGVRREQAKETPGTHPL